MANREYKAGVVEALHLLSGGSCYYPGCGEPTIRFRDGTPKKNVVVAHIHALEDNGPRAIKTMPIPERNSYPNLMLLCHPSTDQSRCTSRSLPYSWPGSPMEPTCHDAGYRRRPHCARSSTWPGRLPAQPSPCSLSVVSSRRCAGRASTSLTATSSTSACTAAIRCTALDREHPEHRR